MKTPLILLLALGGLAGPVAAMGASHPPGARLQALRSPVLLRGDAHTAYRDPLLMYADGRFHLFFSYVREEEEHLIYWYVAVSTSTDLQHWSEPRILTPKDQNLNYSSPGSIVRSGNEWVMALQTYPIVGFHRGDPLRFCDDRARLFTRRSRDLVAWSEPELIRVKGPATGERALGKMIDPFLLPDKDVPHRWWCFYKQAGAVRMAQSPDLKTWSPSETQIAAGENPSVIVREGEYVLFYAPANGVGVKRSTDLVQWRTVGEPLVFGQKDWPWAETRLTAGFVADLRSLPEIGRYVMVFHGMGPGRQKTDANTNANCSIGIAWSDDLATWNWPRP